MGNSDWERFARLQYIKTAFGSLRNSGMSGHEEWGEIQREIDACRCGKDWPELLIPGEQIKHAPFRPDEPKNSSSGTLLFISEAPPKTGGFWAPMELDDDLRNNIFSIVNRYFGECSANRVTDHNSFMANRLFLIQAIKWPLKKSAASLSASEKLLIEHSVDEHLKTEIEMIKPNVIVPLGRAACYACSHLFNSSDFEFDRATRLYDLKSPITVKSSPCKLELWPTFLPVKRNRSRMKKASDEIVKAIKAFN